MRAKPKQKNTIFIRAEVGFVTIRLDVKQIWDWNVNRYDASRYTLTRNNLTLNLDKARFDSYFEVI